MANIFDLFKKIEKKSDTLPVSFIVVGLGNVGKQYEKTRHNAGFLSLDYIAERLGVDSWRVKFNAMVAEVTLGQTRALLMKPTTLMNNSGIAVAAAASFYKIPPENVLVLVDEISFDAGVLRIRRKGSAGGHNGLKSIIAHLGSEDFPRIKIGVGQKPSPDYDLVKWVLGVFSEAEISAISARYADIHDAVVQIARSDIDGAMNKYSK